jgi:hypothetical protein
LIVLEGVERINIGRSDGVKDGDAPFKIIKGEKCYEVKRIRGELFTTT